MEQEKRANRRRLVRLSRQAMRHVQEKTFVAETGPQRSPAFDDPPCFQANDAVGALGQFRVMGDEHERGAGLCIESEQIVDHQASGFDVEITGRFIGKQDFGAVDKRAGERNALLFAARKLQLGNVGVARRDRPD